MSRQSGWISPVVVTGGAVTGTWALDGDDVRVAWFTETGACPTAALEAEVGRPSTVLGRDLRSIVAEQ